MAAFARMLAEQLAHPRGAVGRMLGHAMDVANRSPTAWALEALAAQDGERVLDAGCGTGAALGLLLDRAEVSACGIDPSQAMIAAARARLGGGAELHATAIAQMPFAPASFDAVLLLNVLYFCDEDSRMVADLHRVLRPGGRLVVYVTDRDAMDGWGFVREGLHRTYDADALRHALVLGGFAPEMISIAARPVARGITGLLAVAER